MKKHTSGKSIVFLQETHSTQKVEKLFEYQWRGKMLLVMVPLAVKGFVSVLGTT